MLCSGIKPNDEPTTYVEKVMELSKFPTIDNDRKD